MIDMTHRIEGIAKKSYISSYIKRKLLSPFKDEEDFLYSTVAKRFVTSNNQGAGTHGSERL
jgi:hypothetical protein